VLASLQESPPPDGETTALTDAATKIGMAYSRIQLRSAKAAKLLSHALSDIQAAREALESEASRPLAGPPNLGLPSVMGAGAGGM
jgi:hypothetical protein